MARRAKPRLYIRKFINKPGYHTVASVLATVRGRENTFILSDCDRTVKLDFNAYRDDSRKNALYKAQMLIEILTEFRTALAAEFEANPVNEDDDY